MKPWTIEFTTEAFIVIAAEKPLYYEIILYLHGGKNALNMFNI
jgi:hypothetical protein